MKTDDVTDTLDLALQASGCDCATVLHKPRLPGDSRRKIDAFVEHYNHRRYHENLQNLTPAGVCFGPGQSIPKQRERIKQKTIETRRLPHRKAAA